jgi:2-dehydropantoate 2-reductase
VRHVVLGAGGIGGLLAAVLARSGADVTVLARRSDSTRRVLDVDVRSAVFGDFTTPVRVDTATPVDVDVLWVAVKATGLAVALDLVDTNRLGHAMVVPLLNGIDHVDVLRRGYRTVCPGTIRIESHRISPGVIEQVSPFAHIAIALGHPSVTSDPITLSRAKRTVELLRGGGFEASTSADEVTLLWDKLAFLAPMALATTAHDAPLGRVRNGPDFVQCQQEAVAIARADGARTDPEVIRRLTDSAPAEMKSSMQLDVVAGRQPELDAIGGAILRRAPVDGAPATRALYGSVQARLGR